MDWFVHTDSPTDSEILFLKSDVHVMMASLLENMIGVIMHMSVTRFTQLYVKYPPSTQDIALDGMELGLGFTGVERVNPTRSTSVLVYIKY